MAPSTTDRQLACSVGPFVIDLLVREHRATNEVEIVGQVTRGDSVYQPVAQLTLELVDRKTGEVSSHALTDAFGEFEVVVVTDRPYGLRVDGGPCVTVWNLK